MKFIDASAAVAILANEPQHSAVLRCLDEATELVTSPLAVFEILAAMRRRRAQSAETSAEQVRSFLETAGISVVPITETDGQAALAAFARFGKGQGHPAQLNMGDCFAYACARTREVPLLVAGNELPQTDIAAALA